MLLSDEKETCLKILFSNIFLFRQVLGLGGVLGTLVVVLSTVQGHDEKPEWGEGNSGVADLIESIRGPNPNTRSSNNIYS